MKAWVGASAEVMLLHKVSCKTQIDVWLKYINWEHSGQAVYGWTKFPEAASTQKDTVK